MDTLFNYNGTIGALNSIGFDAYNRAFKYGDGIIETIRIWNGRPVFFENHYNRILSSCKLLQLDFSCSQQKIESEIEMLSQKSNIKNGFVRLELFRSGSGAYVPEVNEVSFLACVTELQTELFSINKQGYGIDIFRNHKKVIDDFSFIKSCNSQFYIQAGLFAKQQGFKTCILLNSKNELIEALYSNLFVVKNKVIYTPLISSGCIEGTMRVKVIELAQKLGVTVAEHNLVEDDLLGASEVFLTNAVRGIEWVAAYKTKRYFNTIAKQLSKELVNLGLDQ